MSTGPDPPLFGPIEHGAAARGGGTTPHIT